MDSLVAALRGAMMVDPEALAELQRYLDSKDLSFFNALLEVAAAGEQQQSSKVVELSVKQFAAIFFKNNSIPLFRKMNEITDEKVTQQLFVLQDQLLAAFVRCEEDMVAVQLSEAIGSIARNTWREYWPNLMPVLLDSLNKQGGANVLVEQRVLSCLRAILQALASRRLPKHKHMFQQLCADGLCEQVTQVWLSDAYAFFVNMRQKGLESTAIPTRDVVVVRHDDQEDAKEVVDVLMEVLLTSTDVMEWIVLHGTPSLSESKSATQFFSAVLEMLPELIKLRGSVVTMRSISGMVRLQLLEDISKLTLSLVKIVVHYQKKWPKSFAFCLDAFLELFWNVMVDAADEPLRPGQSAYEFESLLALVLSFFRNVTQSSEYYKQDCDISVQEAMQSFFTSTRIEHMTDLLLFRFLVLTETNCDEWMLDPETFLLHEQQDKEGFHDHVQPAAEHLFWAVFRQYGQVAAPYVLNYISALLRNDSDPSSSSNLSSALSSSESLAALLQVIPEQFNPRPFCSHEGELDNALLRIKEAIYHGLCVSAQELMDCFRQLKFDFKTWYWQGLRAELQDPCAYIKRRVLLLIGDYTEAFDREVQSDAYGIAVDCLMADDLILAMSALQMARNLTEEEDFERGEESDDGGNNNLTYATMLNARLGDVFTGVFRVLKQCHKVHSKQDVLDTARVFIDSAGIAGLLQDGGSTPVNITEALGDLWGECVQEGNAILRGSIVRTLSCLIETLQEHSVHMHSTLLPLLIDCMDIDKVHEFDHIMKDLLGLMLAVVQSAPSSEELTSALDIFVALEQISAEQFHPLVVLYAKLCQWVQSGVSAVQEHLKAFCEITAALFMLANSIEWFATFAPALAPVFHFILDGYGADSKNSRSPFVLGEVEAQSSDSILFAEAHSEMANSLTLLAGQFPKPIIEHLHTVVARMLQSVLVADPSLQLDDEPLASPGMGFDESASWMDNESQEDASIYASILATLMAADFPLFYTIVVLGHVSDFDFDPVFGPSSAAPIAVVTDDPNSVQSRRDCCQILNHLLYKFMSPWVIRNMDKQQKRFLGAGILALFRSADVGVYALAISPLPPHQRRAQTVELTTFPVFFLPQLFAHILGVEQSRAKDERISNTSFAHELKAFQSARTALGSHTDRVTYLKLRTCTEFGDLASEFCRGLAHFRDCVQQREQIAQGDDKRAWAASLQDINAVMNDLDGSADFESLLALRNS